MNYETLIEERQSLRSFEQKEVPAAALQEVEPHFTGNRSGAALRSRHRHGA